MRRSIGGFFALCLLFAAPAFAAITGTVMNSDGAPVAGATVSTHEFESPQARRARLLSDAPQRRALATAKTDSKGAFSLKSPKNAVVDLAVSASGYSPSSRRVERDEEAGAVVLARAETRTGTITAGGKPVANAVVSASYGSFEYVTKTNEAGKYEAPDPKRLRSIAVVHPDFAIDEEQFGFAQNPSAGELTRALSTGIAISGRVVGTNGETPVANAEIAIEGWPVAKSAEDGTFTIAHAPSRWTTLAARKESLFAQLGYAQEASHTVRLAPASTLTGRVLDSKTKMPVAGTIVRVVQRRAAGSDAPFAAETDAKGAYSIVVPAGTHSLIAAHPSYDGGMADAAVTAGQSSSRDFSFAQLARVSGSVVDEERRPVAAALVTSEDAGDPMSGGFGRIMRMDEGVFSGPDGRFSTRVQGDRPLAMKAAKRGLPVTKSDPLRLAAGERKTGVVLTIPNGLTVKGRVSDAQGNPISGVSVSAAQNESASGMVFRSVIGGASREEDLVQTASDGSFTMQLKEGAYDFTFRREGYAPKTVRGQSVTPAAGTTVEATLEVASDISGRVVRGGAGIEGVRVMAMIPDASGSSAVTGADGSFSISGLPAGSLSVMFRKEDEFIQEMRTFSAPSRDVLVEVSAGGRISGRVIDKATNKPLTVFRAGVSRSGGGMMVSPPLLREFTAEDGSFTLENVPAGAMTVVASAPGYANARVNVTVEAGKTLSDIDVPLDAGVRLTGRVTSSSGAPVSDVSVRLIPAVGGGMLRGTDLPTATTDANGEYTLEALPAGEETISFLHSRYVATNREVTLKGRETRLDVQLSSGTRVTGTVVTEAGAPVPDARVEAMASGTPTEFARTNANGQFELESVMPGRYRFVATKTGLGQGSLEDIDVASGAPVRITMRTGATISGRVTGLPAADLANVMVHVGSGRNSMTAPVSASGEYRVEGAPTGTVDVSAMLHSRNLSAGMRSSGSKTIELAPGASQTVDLEFRGDIVIRGRVTRNNQPVSNATVLFLPRRGSRAQAASSATTDERGTYSLSGVEEGEYGVEVLELMRGNPYSTSYTVSGSATFDIDYRTGGLRGRVLDAATGEPLSNAAIEATPVQQNEQFRMPRGVMTDVAGTFAISEIAAGNYRLRVTRDGYSNHLAEIAVPESGVENFEVKLSRSEGVRLKVVDARDNRPIRPMVNVYDQSGQLVADTMRLIFGGEADGGEVKLNLPPGMYSASIAASGYSTVNVRLQSPGTAAVTVPLTPGGTLVLRSKHSERRRVLILDASGVPAFRFGNSPPYRDLHESPLSTTILNVAPGRYTIQLLAAGSTAVESSIQVDVREGDRTEADI
jgi:uncharacterized GH25 family protein